jgi:hypothetical protein
MANSIVAAKTTVTLESNSVGALAGSTARKIPTATTPTMLPATGVKKPITNSPPARIAVKATVHPEGEESATRK